jgi:hypothetical protein
LPTQTGRPVWPVKHAVLCPQIQLWIIKDHTDWNTSQFLIGHFGPQLLIQRVFHPTTVFILDLAGNGELIILFGDSFPVLFHHFTNVDPP